VRRPLAFALLLLATPARADTVYELTPALELGGGYDSNVLLDQTLDPHELVGEPREAGGILHVSPQATLHLAESGHVVDAAVASTLRFPAGAGMVQDHVGRGLYRTPRLGALAGELGLGIEHGDVRGGSSFTSVDASAGARFRLSRATDLALTERGLFRRDQLLPGVVSQPVGSRALDSGLVLTGRAAHASVSVGYVLSLIESDEPSLDEHRHRLSLGLRAAHGPFTLEADYAFSIGILPEGARLDRQRLDLTHDGGLELTATLTPYLDLFARGSGFFSHPNDGSGNVWRVMAVAGITLHYRVTGHSVAERHRDAAPLPGAPAGQTRVRFTLHAPGAREVAVVGDFNDWDPTRGVMTGHDSFEATLDLAPGRYAWSFLVDGEPRLPEGADTYISDGFGGKNAILVVP
jgi:hypothetical protein